MFSKIIYVIIFTFFLFNSIQCTKNPSHKPLNFNKNLPQAQLDQFKLYKCDDVISESVPMLIQNTKSYLERNIDFWMPFCSLEMITRRNNERDFADIQQAYSASANFITQIFDICTRPSVENRYHSSYTPQSQEYLKIKPMSADEVNEYKNEIGKAVKTMSESCCNSNDTECTKAFLKININFCSNQSDPKLPEPCSEDGGKYSEKFPQQVVKSLSSILDFKKNNNIKLPKEIYSGTIILSTLKNIQDNSPVNSLSTILHELGHACSHIKNQIEAKRGSIGALYNLLASEDQIKNNNRCDLTPNILKHYRTQFSSHNINSKTTNCLINVAKNAGQKRFTKGKCKGGCSRSFLEESFATSLMYKTTINYISSSLQNGCFERKDIEHPLGMDVVKCMLKDPQISGKLKEDLHCSK